MTIERIKNWVKKHKKGVILAAGGTAAAIGVKVFRDNYYIVPSKSDMYTVARHSIKEGNVPQAVKQLGDVDLIWENAEHFNTSISNVPWDKLGEAGKAIQENYEVSNAASVGVMITVPKC